ncbi:FtsX-like permease family protein [Sphingomonas sp. So64.6b]|uniref:ABC transporter permease n=1 Tax=Sphingomonas sp. So64.6b TaxID=2997354 RepID=UPI0016029F2C|nr:FtsX-like permease family protein [Sphingomonas sp. So64.6b]QNA82625.1 FtsX-like permease family protein [Sphingomonas sp. So64.6b]
MSIVWRLALRDLRRGGRGLLLLFLCLFLGTAALAGIGSLSASMVAALDANGRQMLGGDVELTVSQRRATVEEMAAFAGAGRMSETVSMRGMAYAGGSGSEGAGGGGGVLVALRGIDDAWPLVGQFSLAPGALAGRPHGAQVAIAPALAERLGVKVGDDVRIGVATLRVIGLIAEEPDRLGAGFSLGPPVLVDLAGLDATRLVQPGSLYESRYRLVLANPGAATATGDRLVRRFADSGWSAKASDRAAGGLRRGIGQLGQFLLLIGLTALAIAGIGVGSGVAAYLTAKTRIIATLKVLGARSATIAAIFMTQLGLVAAAGVVAGLAVGALVPWIVTGVAGSALPVPPRLALYPVPLVTAALLALLVGLLFATPALARARYVPAASLLREVVARRRLPSARVLGVMALLIVALVALAVLTSSDQLLALGFVGAVAGLIALLWGIGLIIRIGVARLPRPRRPLLRLALANLHRPGAQTDRLVVALGLGFSLFVALAVIDTSLSAELAGTAPAKAPRFFAIDLQPEDAARFRDAVTAASPGARVETVPSLRGSITVLRGVRVADMKVVPEDAWVLRGDRTITWAATVPPRNEVVAGRWWPADYRGPPLVSLEDKAAAALGLKIGDMITVSVLGVDVPARIASLRKIDWNGLGLNFAIIFSPGYIEEAPHGLLASVYSAPTSDGAVASRVGTILPSVTLIRVGDVIGQIGLVLGQVALAIRAAAAVTVAAGIAVLVGAVAASGRSRRYDAVILKLLGGSRRQVLGAQAFEYAMLSLVLIIVALVMGSAAGWFVVVRLFDLAWAPRYDVVALTLAASVIVTLGTGLAGSVPALRARPAEALREL